MRVFLSQPMNGRSDQEILNERQEILELLQTKFLDVELLDTFFTDACQWGPLQCLGKAIELLADADCAFFAAGWEQARGCRIEHACCEEYKIRILYDGSFAHDQKIP